MNRAVVEERRVGTRVLAGTEWPIVDQLVRHADGRAHGGWQIIRGLCNGVPDGATFYPSESAAREAWEGRVR